MQPTNCSRRYFFRNTSLAATGLFLLPRQLFANEFLNPAGQTAAPSATNPVQIENAKPGTTAWQLTNPAINREVEGYASLTSVNRGGQIRFFISVAQSQQVNIDIYRMGWYAGNGGRLLTHTSVTASNQLTPAADSIGLIDCNWNSQYTLNVPNNTSDPTDWASGIYLAKLTAASGKQSYIIFVVRDDARFSDFLYQSSFTTYQAYNDWPYSRNCGTACAGSRSLYAGNSDANGPAWKVSFNRPFAVGQVAGSERGVGAGEFLSTGGQNGCGWEYNMVRWLEMKGYDVTYATNIDTHEKTDLLLSGTTKKHKAFFSVGHDEYWSWQMRDRVEQARNQGVSLGFFSSNVCFWQVRFEASKTGQANRTMVAYKWDALVSDPYARDADPSNDRMITVQWRDNPVNRPEAGMVGVMYWGDPYMADMVITNPNHWMCSGTNLKLNDRLPQLIGYEVDSVTNSSPVNIDVLGHSPVGTGYADTSTYIAASGAVVFASASNQWSWGLDNYNATGASPLRAAIANAKVKQMTSNLLARMLGRRLPVASAGGPYTGKVGTAVAFNGSSSSDADGTIVSYAWTFSDGATETGPTPSHKFSAAGTYEVNLVVIDDMDAAHSSSTSVTIGTGEPALSAPSELVAQSDSGNSGHVLLTWVDNSDNEQLFRIERSLLADTGFAPIDQVKANVTSYTDKATDKGVLYYYRVQAVNETTVSAFSNIASLVTSGGKNGKREAAQSTEGKQDSRVGVEASELNLRALPNPSNGAFNVQIQSPVADKINLRVVDAQGRVVDQLNRMQPNQVIKIGETYRPGVYFMEAQQGAKKVLLKLVKVAN